MCAFKKWHQQSADFFRVSLHVGKGREQRLAQRGGSIEVPVVGAFLPGVMPEPLRGIEIRKIRGQRKHLDLPAVLRKELQEERQAMNDKQIRVAVHQKLFRHYSATPEP